MSVFSLTGVGLCSDFYNWNKVFVRYCDGASFSGDAEGEAEVIFLGSNLSCLSEFLKLMLASFDVEWNQTVLQRIAHLGSSCR